MADDRRPRNERRVGDATQARIDDMAKGWKKAPGGSEEAKSDPAEAPARPKRRSSPPPPPPPKSARTSKSPSKPPPLPVPRAPSPPAGHVAGPAHARTIKRKSSPGLDTKTKPPTPVPSRPPVPKPRTDSVPPLFDASKVTADGLADQLEPSTDALVVSEVRAEGSPLPLPSEQKDADATVIPTGEESQLLAELKPPAALRREPGIWGDMRYVGTVIFGRRRHRIELAETELEIEAEKRSRDKELTEFARLAVSDPNVSIKIVDEAREKLVELEDARSRKAGAAVAAEQAIGAILRERDKVKEQREAEITGLEADIAELETKLEPLEKRRLEIGKRAREVVDSVERYDNKIKELEASLATASPDESVNVEATLAATRAEREVAAKRQPALASELAEVEPKIRELKAEKGELAKKVNKLKRAEDESVVRSEEKVTAARAHKLVVDRAAADRTREQNELLRELGEDLYKSPPPSVAHLAGTLEDRFATVARLKSKAVEAREKIESVETLPLLRGIGLWLVVAIAIAGIAFGVTKIV